MGVKLMVEVLDHYDGPHKLWLVGFAEQANDETRVGWPRRDLLARRADVTVWRSSHIAAELAAEGAIKRPDWEPDEGRDRRRAVYVLLPLAGADDGGTARKRTRKRATGSTKDGATDSTDPAEIGAIHDEIGAIHDGIGAIEPRVSADQTANLPSPQSPQSPHIKPSRRTTRNRSSGEPAATDDDDDSSSQPANLDGHADGAARLPARARPGPGYGLCPECRDLQVVKATGGRIGRHNADVGGRYDRCPGSGRPPVEPVPCTKCGRTGVALTGFAGLCHACREAIKAAEAPDAGEYPF